MRKNTISSFIQKTWDILQDTQNSQILKWSQDGNSFLIINDKQLCENVLPKHFKHSNFSSFIRQLNMYNFHKKKTNDEAMEFYHRLFRKDKKELLIGIKRKPSQAEIQFGQELIRKMNKQSSKSSQENSMSDGTVILIQENKNTNLQKEHRSFRRQQLCQSTCRSQYLQSPLTTFYPFWILSGSPLFEINHLNASNVGYEYQQRKILTNIILKNPPNEREQ